MTEIHRVILNRHWKLLSTYINPTDDFITTLVTEKVLPSSMADDIRAGKDHMEKNTRLLKSMKLRGNSSFRKFRQILMSQGQMFIAEMLWDDDKDTSCFIEESDFDAYHVFKTSLNPLEQKQLIWALDSKIKSRILKSEWRNNSEERMAKLQVKIEGGAHIDDHKTLIGRMKLEIAAKNDNLRTVVKDFNDLNDDVASFLARHRTCTRVVISKSLTNGDKPGNSNSKEVADSCSRFFDIDSIIYDLDKSVSDILDVPQSAAGGNGSVVSIRDLRDKMVRLEKSTYALKATLDCYKSDMVKVRSLLEMDDSKNDDATLLEVINCFLSQQQSKRVSLLMDIDNLSRKLRDLNGGDTKSGLNGLRQSAVTGSPSPAVVDFRFLRNHLALLNADADHFSKRMRWKDDELRALKNELVDPAPNHRSMKRTPRQSTVI